jgi:hypothetical protein
MFDRVLQNFSIEIRRSEWDETLRERVASSDGAAAKQDKKGKEIRNG